MRKRIVLTVNIFILMFFFGCSGDKEESVSKEENNGWQKECQVKKSIRNLNFNFPAGGFAFDHKSDFVDQSLEAMQSNAQIIGLEQFTDTIQIRFLRSRDDMFGFTGLKASGTAYPHIHTLYVVADGKKSPPIKHELMHLIAMLKWGYPHFSSTWINEGLATYAEANCNGYPVSKIYRYLLETDRLIEMDSLRSNFYRQEEMIAYHQSAYMVDHLLNRYSLEQFKELWTKGFDSFQSIYGISFSKVKADLEKAILEKYPTAPDIDWETFKKGCK
jgi:peptidase MA superfamily protein